ncbi:hypothetical protein PHACT_12595 [Pseudohongiella acticola]|uniref:Uncharacterized protein n=1 Tax=Pseudohongiella acticola TaxID=1524254 RepID=A0A1E8CFZ9_9GAMM|nr:hypothetical protein PHACT_12595 [Pseudohongiella acticola]
MLNAISFLIGLAGAVLMATGFWMIYPGLGLIVGGFLCLAWSWLVSRAVASQQPPTDAGGKH